MEWADFERYVEVKINVTFAEPYVWCCMYSGYVHACYGYPVNYIVVKSKVGKFIMLLN